MRDSNILLKNSYFYIHRSPWTTPFMYCGEKKNTTEKPDVYDYPFSGEHVPL